MKAGSVYRPVVEVQLALPNGLELLVPAIVDSGADETTFPAAALQGIDWDNLEPAPVPFIRGVGGRVQQRQCAASARYDGSLFGTQVRVVRELRVAVVGRNDFSRTFAVDFSAWNEKPPAMEISHRA